MGLLDLFALCAIRFFDLAKPALGEIVTDVY